MNALANYLFEGAAIRVRDQTGDLWFVAVDVCTVLGLENSRMAVTKLDEDEKGVCSIDTLGGTQNVTIISESGLYALILRCRDAMTPGTVPHRFRKWVTSEVIPSIRRTGGFGVVVDPMAALGDPATMRSLLLGYTERVIALEAENQTLAPKAEALDRIANASGSLCITDAAKALQVPPRRLFDWLQQHHWIYKRHGTGWIGYSDKTQTGLLEHKMTTVDRADGSQIVNEQVRVTPKGLTKLSLAFGLQEAA